MTLNDLKQKSNDDLNKMALKCISNLNLHGWNRKEGESTLALLCFVQQEQIRRLSTERNESNERSIMQ